jgi:transcriptional antiterminator NusG
METQDLIEPLEVASGATRENEQLAAETVELSPAAVEEAPAVAGESAEPQGMLAAPVSEAETAATAEGAPEGAEAQEGAPPAAEVKDDRAWYVVHSYSGYENKVKKNLEHRIESMNVQHKIFQVTVPTEEEIEIKEGHRRKTKRRVFPGYILVQMIMDDDSWYVVRNTPGVTGFVSSGTGNKPSPLRPDEIDKILSRMEMEAPKIKVSFREGQTVRIVDGPFADFVGTVEEMNLDKGKVRVLVSFFGRETPVELDFLQVQRQ